MTDLPLSKTLDPADFDQLGPELEIVDHHFTAAREQHPMRRWEYAMALRALAAWQEGKDYREPSTIADVGGAGSPFRRILSESRRCWPLVIDPEEGGDLAHYLATPNWVAEESHPMLQQAVFCLSVLEHVKDLDRFLYHLSCLVAPGGLLFLTVDFWNRCGPDAAHFHWMRERIFCPKTIAHEVIGPLSRLQFSRFGESDLQYHGSYVYDYTFCSIAVVKRP